MVGRGLQPLCVFFALCPGVLCVFVVALRIWTRLRNKQYGIEDTLLAIATVLNLVLSVTTCGYIFTSYYGYRFEDIPEGAVDHTLSMKWNYANSCIYNPILALVKVPFLWTLLKLRSPNKWITTCLWVTLILNSCFAVAAPSTCLLQCSPIPSYWDKSIPGKCVHPGAYTVSTSSIVLATDVLILLMPTWILHDLKMPLARKLTVILFLSFGVAVTVVGAIRTSVLVKVFVLGQHSSDPTYGISYILSNIESGLAIIGTCGPTFKAVFSFCIPALRIPDDTTERRYVYPSTGGYYGEIFSRRYAKGKNANAAIDTTSNGPTGTSACPRIGQINDSVELDCIAGNERSYKKRKIHDEDETMAITKTIAWRIDGAHPDSNSASEQEISMPRHIL